MLAWHFPVLFLRCLPPLGSVCSTGSPAEGGSRSLHSLVLSSGSLPTRQVLIPPCSWFQLNVGGQCTCLRPAFPSDWGWGRPTCEPLHSLVLITGTWERFPMSQKKGTLQMWSIPYAHCENILSTMKTTCFYNYPSAFYDWEMLGIELVKGTKELEGYAQQMMLRLGHLDVTCRYDKEIYSTDASLRFLVSFPHKIFISIY